MRNKQLHNDTGIPYLNILIKEKFKIFHSKNNFTEDAFHYEIEEQTRNCKLKPHLPQDVFLSTQSSESESS